MSGHYSVRANVSRPQVSGFLYEGLLQSVSSYFQIILRDDLFAESNLKAPLWGALIFLKVIQNNGSKQWPHPTIFSQVRTDGQTLADLEILREIRFPEAKLLFPTMFVCGQFDKFNVGRICNFGRVCPDKSI